MSSSPEKVTFQRLDEPSSKGMAMIRAGRSPTRRQEDETGNARMSVHNGSGEARKKTGRSEETDG